MNIPEIIRLGPDISTGVVIKMFLQHENTNEVEHSLHIISDGSIKKHFHNDEDGISEGYREFYLDIAQFGEWEVVGAGMPKKSHEVPYSPGFRLIEGSKRKGGIEAWPELNNT